MTQTYRSDLPLDRRTVLRGLGAAGLAGFVGVPAFSGSVAADSHVTETLYLTDSGGDNGGSHLTKLFSVDLDDSYAPPRANLELVLELTDTDFDQVDAIAASLDGETVYMVDKDSRHLGTYDVPGDAFVDHGEIVGLPGGVVLASFSPDGDLLVVSQNDNTMYTVDPNGPTATKSVTISGATVTGADIAFDAAGVLYLYSSSAQSLYTVDDDAGSATFGQATFVGETGDFFTGLAVRASGTGDLVGSNTTRDEIVVVSKSDGSQGTAFDLYYGDAPYAYGYGDMTVGALELCEPCDADGLLAKYEFECVDWADGDCTDWDFVLEGEGDGYISYTGASFTSKDGEMYEPTSVTFETEYCELYALVKSGQEFEVQSFADIDGAVTVETANDCRYAISFVAFYCTEADAMAALERFPSRGRGGD